MTRDRFCGRKEEGLNCVKISLLLPGFFLALSAISQAGPIGGRGSGGGVHAGFVARGVNPGAARGFNRGVQPRFIAPRNGPAFRTANGMHPDVADRRFRFRNRGVFIQPVWPVYWDPYNDPLAYSYLEPDSQPDYQYWDNSSGNVQPGSNDRTTSQSPVIIVVNNGSPQPISPNPLTEPRGDGRYVADSYLTPSPVGQQRMIVQDPNQHVTADSGTAVDPVDPQPTPVPPQNAQASLKPGPGVFGKYVVVSWLQDRGKDEIFIKNIETNDVQRITSQPNIDHFRIVEVHPNPDLRQFEAVISNGSEQGPVRFQF